MDARDAAVRLQGIVTERIGDDPVTPQAALAAFVVFAREEATYEDGSVEEDVVRFETSSFDPPGPWPAGDRPPIGAFVVDLTRDINVYDGDGEHQECAEVGFQLALPPMASDLLDDPALLESPAGADVDPTDPDPLEAFAADVLASLGDLATVPATHVFVGGDVPTAPTLASLSRPAAGRPIRIHLVEGALADALRSSRTAGHERDTRRALAIMLDFCARPIDPGDATVTRDELLVTWAPPFPGEGAGESTLRFERSYELTHSSSGRGHGDTVEFDLVFDPGDGPVAAGPWVIFRAPAASSPHGRLGPAFDPGRPYVDLATMDEVEPRMIAAGFGLLLDRWAARIKGPC